MSWQRRASLFAAVLVIHLLLFAIVMRTALSAAPAPGPGTDLTIVDVAAPSPPPPAAPRPVPQLVAMSAPVEPPLPPAATPTIFVSSPAADMIATLAPPAPVPLPTTPIVLAPGQACPTLDLIESTLRDDPAVAPALARIPAAARSVANAIMLWDGLWTDPERLGGVGAIDPIRDAMLRALSRLPASCLDMLIIGPRLVFLPDRDRVTAIAFGSGKWHWRDMTMTTQSPVMTK